MLLSARENYYDFGDKKSYSRGGGGGRKVEDEREESMNHQSNNQLNQRKKSRIPDILVKRLTMNYRGVLGRVMMIVGRKRVGNGDRWKHMIVS